jgi:hypothetical protein
VANLACWKQIVALALLTSAVGAPGFAFAQQPSQSQISAIKKACRSDYQEHCANVPTGGSAALSCLQQNAPSLSQPCQTALGAIGGAGSSQSAPSSRPAPRASGTAASPREEAGLVRESCGMDYRTYCRGVRPGGGRGIACLKDNGQSLSPGCQQALMSLQRDR